MASSSCHVHDEIKHGLFISFRGPDVRRGLLSHLVKELRRGHIDTYVDNRLERGDEISSSLVSAIEGSQISLVIFSKDYASSKWCLEELVKMVECMERNKQIVIPIFYNVDPSDVRHQKGDYGAALAKHEEDFKENIVKVRNWRFSLQKAAQLSGFHYASNFENESDLVDEIIKDVSNKLSKLCLSKSNDPRESNDLVGIDQNIAWIKSLLTNETREVLKLGIWGMGGIGKTTVASIVFDTFSPHYEGSCFLENVREQVENHQLISLRQKVVSKLLEKESSLINGICKTSYYIERLLSRKKVLIVLDDMNTPNPLKDFLEHIRLGPGSRIIVTSRDKQVFTVGGFNEIHKVKELNFEDSLKLFCLNAFNESHPDMGYEELSKRVVVIAKGNPLALKVFGSHLHSKSKDIWECALRKLKKHPDQNIQRVLKLSYDELDDSEKKVFLDIAFFFKEEVKDYAISQLDAWDFHGTSGIETLQDKALITISNEKKIQMHDLIQEMGWEIVRQESTDVGRRSQLRDPEDVRYVLKDNKGTDAVEGMLLDGSHMREVAFNFDCLKSMPKLRFLKIYSSLPRKLPPRINIEPMYVDSNKDFKILPLDVLEEKCLKMIHELFDEYKRWQQRWDALVTHERRCIQLLVTKSLSLADEIFQDLEQIRQGFFWLGNSSLYWICRNMYVMRDIINMLQHDDCNVLCDVEIEISKSNIVNGSSHQFQNADNKLESALRELSDHGVEVHDKVVKHIFMDGCTIAKGNLSLNRKLGTFGSSGPEFGLLSISPGGYFSFRDLPDHYDDDDGLQLFETVPDKGEFHFLRVTSYHTRTSGSGREQEDTITAGRRKPKPLALFDGYRYSYRLTYTSLGEFITSAIDFEQFLPPEKYIMGNVLYHLKCNI